MGDEETGEAPEKGRVGVPCEEGISSGTDGECCYKGCGRASEVGEEGEKGCGSCLGCCAGEAGRCAELKGVCDRRRDREGQNPRDECW